MIKLITFILQLFIIASFMSCESIAKKDITNPKQEVAKAEIPQEITIIFGGDVMMHYPQISAAKQKGNTYDFSSTFKHIKPYWEDADAVIVNLETTLSDTEFSGYPMFAAPYQLAQDLKKSGITHIVTANNHTCDKKAVGISKTIKYLNEAGLYHTGSFNNTADYNSRTPLFIEKAGLKVALLNYTYGTNGMPIPRGKIVSIIDTTSIRKDIIKAQNAKATNIITFMHWGNEYKSEPSKAQTDLARWLHRAGVDIVVGSHPHVVQPLEYEVGVDEISGVTIYSLGNLVSNQRKRRTDGGINVKLKIARENGKSKYTMRYKSWYVDKKVVGGKWSYVLVDEDAKDYRFTTKKSKQSAELFYDDTKQLLGWELSQ